MLGLWLNTTTHKMILLPYLLFFYVHNVISLLIIVFFRLPCPPLAKRGSLTHSQALALSKRARDVTAPPVALNRCAIRLAGHQSPRQVVMRDGTALLKAGHQSPHQVVRDGTALLMFGFQHKHINNIVEF